MIQSKHKAVIFDFDDTLVKTIGPVWEQHKYVAQQYFGIQLADEDIKKAWGQPLPQFVETLYGRSFAEVEPRLLEHKLNFPKELLPEAKALLEKLSAQGKHIAVVTSTNRNSIGRDLNSLRLSEDIFFDVVTIDDVEYYKPDPRVFVTLFERFAGVGVPREAMVYIGDSATDFMAARDAGIDFIGVAQGLLTRKDFQALKGWEASGAVAVSSLSELLEQPN